MMRRRKREGRADMRHGEEDKSVVGGDMHRPGWALREYRRDDVLLALAAQESDRP